MARKKTTNKKTTKKTEAVKKSAPVVEETLVEEDDLDDDDDDDLDDEDTDEDPSPKSDIPTEDGEGDSEDVVVLKYSRGSTSFTAFDAEAKKARNMTLTRGENKVPAELFEFFEKSEFFGKKILGSKKNYVTVISRPAKSVDEVDI